MRVSWFLLGVGGLSAIAAASPTFQTIIKSGDALPGGGTFDPEDASVYQVVVANGGQVAINASTNDSGVVFFYNGSTFSPVIQNGNAVGTQLDFFDNLAISGNGSSGTRLSFVGGQNEGGNNVDYGVYQFNVGAALPQQIAFNGLNGLTLDNTVVDGDIASLPLQVNATGQVAFTAADSTGSNLKVEVGGIGSTLTNLFTSASGSFQQVNSTDRLGIDTNGNVDVPLANSSSVRAIYTVSGGTPVNDSGSYTQTGVHNTPELLAVAHGGGVNASLFTINDPTHNNGQDLVLNDGTGTHQLYTPSASDNGVTLAAEMTPNGQLAYFEPNSAGGVLNYYKVSSDTQTQVAAVGQTGFFDPAHPATSYIIEGLQTAGGMFNPMINSSGLTVFDAEVSSDGGATEHQALLYWNPNDADPTPKILLQDGDTVPGFSGDVIDDILTDVNTQAEADVMKDTLADDGTLAVTVDYNDGEGEAVLLTSIAVPEPASFSMLALAGVGLLRRRRRVTP